MDEATVGTVRVEFFMARLRFPDGREWCCDHKHGIEKAAQECAEEERGVASQQFGQELQRLRAAWGFSLHEVAGQLEISQAAMSRLERMEALTRPVSVAQLLEVYQVPPVRREELLDWYRRIRTYRLARTAAKVKATRAANRAARRAER